MVASSVISMATPAIHRICSPCNSDDSRVTMYTLEIEELEAEQALEEMRYVAGVVTDQRAE